MHQITIQPENRNITAKDGGNLREALIENDIAIKSSCAGHASCAECIVVITDGANKLSEINFEEKQILGNVFHMTAQRLSCQTKVYGDIAIIIENEDIKKAKPVAKTQRRTQAEAQNIVLERKEKSKSRPQKQGGFKKPKTFTTEHEE